MSKTEMGLLGGAAAALFAFFFYLTHAVHAENMECIKAGGTMKDRACHFAKREQ